MTNDDVIRFLEAGVKALEGKNWKRGPLPLDTWGWGGITTETGDTGFYFADFCGDHVKLIDGTVVSADKVVMFNNSLELPPGSMKRKG